ncbi:MAG: TolC family protein [Tannerella sp.]|jgi:outer membrane protein TolC|nr:TolC family protein [Tannerella sp.]
MRRLLLLIITVFVIFGSHARRTLTLDECRKLAIQNNKELQIAKQQINAASYEQKAAVTKYFPQIAAQGMYMRTRKRLNLVDWDKVGGMIPQEVTSGIMSIIPEAYLPYLATIPDDLKKATEINLTNLWVGNLSFTQPVFMGGKIVSCHQIAKYARELAKTQNDARLQEVIYMTDETYWQVVSLANKKKLAEAYVELLQSMDDDVQKMIAEGVATKADGLSVKVKLNEAEVTLTRVENGLSLARMLLAQICGLPLNEELLLTDEQLEKLPVKDQDKVTVNIDEAWTNRNELKSLDYAIRIYKKKENIVLSEALPNVAFTASYWVTNPNLSNGIQKDFDAMWTAGIAVNIPLSGWAENSFKRNSARAETLIKKLEWEDAKEKIELDINQSVYKMNEAQKKLQASNRNMENAEENLRTAKFGFKEGVIPSLNLLEAQTAWVSATSELIDSQIEVKLTETYLMKAMGTLNVSH